MTSAARPRIVIVGGGVAGMEIATSLGRRSLRGPARRGLVCDVILIDRDSAHIWKPMLHTIAAGTRDMGQQQTSFLAQAREAGFTYEPGELRGLDRDRRQVLLGPFHAPDGSLVIPARAIAYDTLIVAVGSEANDFSTPGVKDYCRKIDSRLQADAFNQEVRIALLHSLVQKSALSIAIVGGGATGVELAAQLVELTDAAIGYGARDLAERIKISLIESGPRLLPAFPEDISAATLTRLSALGIKVMINTRVTQATEQGFVFGDGSQMSAALKVWAAGVKAPEFLNALSGLETSRVNQLIVLPSLQTTLDKNIFAVGDCASLTLSGSSQPLPPTAQVAHQQALHLIRCLPDFIAHGKPVPAFAYRNLGAIVSLGNYDAFGSLGQFGFFTGVTFRGRLAQLGQVFLYRSHQARIHGFWRGSLLWLVDLLNSRIRPSIRLD